MSVFVVFLFFLLQSDYLIDLVLHTTVLEPKLTRPMLTLPENIHIRYENNQRFRKSLLEYIRVYTCIHISVLISP